MLSTVKTDSQHPNFQQLVKELDYYLAIKNGDDNPFYAQFNKIDLIDHVILVQTESEAVGCGAIKEIDVDTMEIKRMFVPEKHRGNGVATLVLKELEKWAEELGYKKCRLETGTFLEDAVGLYRKNGYTEIPNYGPYLGIEKSICFEKIIGKNF